MKNLFVLMLCAITFTASAQKQPATDSIGTTVNGLPVLKSYVAPDVVERAKKKFGRSLYSIEKTIGVNCQNSYLVGLIRNGHLTMQWMCDDAKMVLHINKRVLPARPHA